MSESDTTTATDQETGGHPRGPLSPEEIARRTAAKAKNAEYKAVIANGLANIKELPTNFIEAIKALVNLDSRRAPNSLYTRVIDFIKETGEGNPVDDMTLFKRFRVSETDMRKVIYQGQDDGEWISAVETPNKQNSEINDVIYTYVGQYPEWPNTPEGYPGPIRKVRTKSEAT